jgi:hypothetical protein
MKILNRVIVVLTVIVVTSCSAQRISLSQNMIDQNNLSFEDLNKLQYYTKNRITIERIVNSDYNISTSTHKLVTKSGKKYEIITIKAGTPCVCEKAFQRNDRTTGLMISFEPGYSVEFSISSSGDFSMCHSSSKGKGFVEYANNTYNYTTPLILAIDKSSIKKISYDRRVLPGRRINN